MKFEECATSAFADGLPLVYSDRLEEAWPQIRAVIEAARTMTSNAQDAARGGGMAAAWVSPTYFDVLVAKLRALDTHAEPDRIER